jgi:hypothetical protein
LVTTTIKETLDKSFRLLTASFRALPAFLVIGTQKGGTTSLFNNLSRHYQIIAPRSKETHYFDNNFYKNFRFYKSAFPFRNKNRNFITGESTPNYLYHKLVPKRICKYIPNVKLIVLLRDPVLRAFSHHQYLISRGEEHLSFEDAVKAEAGRVAEGRRELADNPYVPSIKYQRYAYMNKGMYAKQLKRWFNYFPTKQFLILKSEEFFENPNYVFLKVLNFLDLEEWSDYSIQPYNVNTYTKLSKSLYEDLQTYFEPYNKELENLLGRKFNWYYPL